MSRAEPARPGRSPLDIAGLPDPVPGPGSGGSVQRGLDYLWGANLARLPAEGSRGKTAEAPLLAKRRFREYFRARGALMRRGAGKVRETRASVLRIGEAGESERKFQTGAQGRAFREQKRARLGALCFGAKRKSPRKKKGAQRAFFFFFGGVFLRQKPRPSDHPATVKRRRTSGGPSARAETLNCFYYSENANICTVKP